MSSSPTGSQDGARMHRRKSSKEEDENMLIFPMDEPSAPIIQPPPPPTNGKHTNTVPQTGGPVTQNFSKFIKPDGNEKAMSNGPGGWAERSRVASNPTVPSLQYSPLPTSHSHPVHPPSAGPYRTSFAAPWTPHTNGAVSYANGRHQPPAMRQSLSLPSDSSHARTRSVSGPFSPITPSPLATSFPVSHTTSRLSHQSSMSVSHDLSITTSATAPELYPSHSPPKSRFPFGNGLSSPPGTSAGNKHRHSRIHSRNLSVYFPRPSSISVTSIDEDNGQEVNFSSSSSYMSRTSSEDSIPMPTASPGPGQRSFREGFTFGGQPTDGFVSSAPLTSPIPSGALRRGHHHKHSLSHNFFSFLEPGELQELHTAPTMTPVSPWNPISPWPHEQEHSHFSRSSSPVEGMNGHLHASATREKSPVGWVHAPPRIDTAAVIVAVVQFVLGACLWVVGQQIGSLSCTGLGYWVVFDSFGVALGRVLPGYLAKPQAQGSMRRPYGNSRIETLMTYAQSVYLLFASVYVCKETVEHVLLASGEGHHHHHGDEVADIYGINFPPLLLCITMLSLIGTSLKFNNQAKLVSATGNYIPPLPSLLPVRISYSISHYSYPPIIANLLSNPYTLAPTLFCAALLGGYSILPPYQHRYFDLLLAAVETVVTFSLAYPAAVALGAVLLQTAPPRGLPGGRMEAFLRAMREIERHPQVLHLPAPHIWQLAPYYARPPGSRSAWEGPAQSLVVTLELHVPKDLSDDDVLRLTTWAWERCKTALRYGSGDGGGDGEADITVGVVRG